MYVVCVCLFAHVLGCCTEEPFKQVVWGYTHTYMDGCTYMMFSTASGSWQHCWCSGALLVYGTAALPIGVHDSILEAAVEVVVFRA